MMQDDDKKKDELLDDSNENVDMVETDEVDAEEIEEKEIQEENKKEQKAQNNKAKKIKKKDFPMEIKEKKEFKDTALVKNFNIYKFIVKLIAFGILVAFGIMILIFKDNATGAIYLITGIIASFSALFRIYPLMKTLKTHRARLVSLIEIICDCVVGVYLVIAAFVLWGQVNSYDFQLYGDYNWFNDFNFKAYKYILIALLGSRSIIYYYQTYICKEDSTKVLFYLHTGINITAIVLGCIQFESKDVPLILAILAFISAAVIGGEAGGGYYRYKKTVTSKGDEKEKRKETGAEAPGKDEDKIISDIDPNIVPENDTNQDSVIM